MTTTICIMRVGHRAMIMGDIPTAKIVMSRMLSEPRFKDIREVIGETAEEIANKCSYYTADEPYDENYCLDFPIALELVRYVGNKIKRRSSDEILCFEDGCIIAKNSNGLTYDWQPTMSDILATDWGTVEEKEECTEDTN